MRGEGFTAKSFRFNDIELVPDRREYNPGDKVQLMINTNKEGGVVLLFLRPTHGVYLAPKMIRLHGKTALDEVLVAMKDMPNFFIEAVTIADGRVHSDVREIIVPPEKRVLNVEVLPSQQEYKPGQSAKVKVRLTDFHGKPFVGSTVVSVYDKSVEYISGGSNVPEIKEFYWKWRRGHHPHTESNLNKYLHNLLKQKEIGMSNLRIFGDTVVEELAKGEGGNAWYMNRQNMPGGFAGGRGGPVMPTGGGGPGGPPGMMPADGLLKEAAMPLPVSQGGPADIQDRADVGGIGGIGGEQPLVQPSIRKNFADTAYWNANLTTNKDGIAEIDFKMPENLTAWRVRVWAMGHGTKVGQGDADVVTKKDLIVRLQAPRFFTEKDEVVLSANVHNYLKREKKVQVSLEVEGGTLGVLGTATQNVVIASGGEQRVDWRVKVQKEGTAVVRMKALTDEDSDAMEMRFPCYVHGMLKMESFTGVIRPEKDYAKVLFNVPAERRINDTVLEVRYSPSLAAAMVDALPYLVDYPYGCTEQTLNRFLPTVITQKILLGMKLNLKEIEKHQVNLNSQEIGEDKERIKQWKRFKVNPVFDENEVRRMAAAGVQALAGMQISDGGWGWFSGFHERSYPHTTAVVVHGLQVAKDNGVPLPANMLERGVDWLKGYQAEQIRRLQNAPTKTNPWKEFADNTDALVYMVLVDG
ncbi:MAG: hypothetical protein L0Y70_08395, partial [Gemmataceae bacterium]|nr:hypothetical protein [Gemmataceae bacterium]